MLLLALAVGAVSVGVVAAIRPTLPTLPDVVVPAAIACGSVAVAQAGAAVTGWIVLDLVLGAALGALVVAAATTAGRVAHLWLLGGGLVAVVLGQASTALAVTAAVVGASLAAAAAGADDRASRAVSTAGALVGLSHLDWPVATWAPSGLVAVAVLPTLVLGLVRAPAPWRRRIGLSLVGTAAALGLGAGVGLAAALSASGDVEDAIDDATRGLDLLGDDDDAARAALLDAAGAFGSAEETLTAWWARPALLVPVVAQQSRAVSTMASAGEELARTAAEATDEADVDAVQPVDGRIDLDALAALSDPLERSLDALVTADRRLAAVGTPLLLPPVAERLASLTEQVDDALGTAELAARAVRVAPGMLGADGPKRYFVAVQQPAELTGNGGFMGNWAELVADDGELRLERSGRVRELVAAGDRDGRRIDTEPDYVDMWGQNPAEYWGAINLSPDHPTVSRVMAELYPESGGAELDGVLSVTPMAIAALLDVTGPIEVEGYPQRLDESNAEAVLLHEQYLTFPNERGEDREAFLQLAIEQLFDRLTSGSLPGPRGLADQLGPAVEARALQLWAADPDAQALLERIGMAGDVTRRSVDSVGVVTQNFNGNKIDWFLRRSLAYEVDWDPATGRAEGTVTAEIANTAPDRGLPASIIGWGGDEVLGQRPVADGENFMLVTVYATLPIQAVEVDGRNVPFRAEDDLGHATASLYLSVPSGGTRNVVARTAGTVGDAPGYEVRALRQHTAVADEWSLAVRLPEGWRAVAPDGAGRAPSVAEGTNRADLSLRIVAERPRSAGDLLARLRGARG